MYCGACGSKLEQQAAFCGNCGTAVPARQTAPVQPPVPGQAPDQAQVHTPNQAAAQAPDNQDQAQAPIRFKYQAPNQPPVQNQYTPPVQAPHNAPAPLRSVADRKVLIVIAVIAVAVIFGAYKLFSGGGSQSDPASTVESFIEAADDHDIEEMMEYFLPNPDLTERELQRAKINLEQNIYDFDVKKYKIIHVEENGNQALVEYMIIIESGGEQETNEDEFELVRVDGKWYIDEDIFDL